MPTERLHRIAIEPLTAEAFAPFGELIGTKDRPPDFRGESGTEGWAIDFKSGTPLVMLLRTPYVGLRFSKLERHFNVTQSFLPMGGSPAVLAVAARGNDDRGAPPAPEAVRAFLLDGTVGYALARGTWHSLDRFPLYPPATQWVILTDHETQRDLPGPARAPERSTLTHEVDYHARFGVTFQLVLG